MTEKLALITGASEGIGREFAKQLAAEGYQITAVARNESRLKELMTELQGSHSYKVADLSRPEGIEAIEKELASKHYHLLVNNAGFGIYGKFYSLELEKLMEMIRVNCEALVRFSHAFLKRSESGDALINVSSTLAFLPMPASGLYSATKAFVTSFSESLWYEQKERGVYVMDLCPGVTKTLFHDRAGGKEDKRPPESITQTPQQVVQLALHALKKRSRPTVISGKPNLLMASMTRMMPRKSVVKMMGSMR